MDVLNEYIKKEVILQRYDEYIWLYIYECQTDSMKFYKVKSNKPQYVGNYFNRDEAVNQVTNIMRELTRNGYIIMIERVFE